MPLTKTSISITSSPESFLLTEDRRMSVSMAAQLSTCVGPAIVSDVGCHSAKRRERLGSVTVTWLADLTRSAGKLHIEHTTHTDPVQAATALSTRVACADSGLQVGLGTSSQPGTTGSSSVLGPPHPPPPEGSEWDAVPCFPLFLAISGDGRWFSLFNVHQEKLAWQPSFHPSESTGHGKGALSFQSWVWVNGNNVFYLTQSQDFLGSRAVRMI